MKRNDFLSVLGKLSRKKNAVTFVLLNNLVRGFKALPSNGKRWKKGESPKVAEVRFLLNYSEAIDLCRGPQCDKVAFIVWASRKEFEELTRDTEG